MFVNDIKWIIDFCFQSMFILCVSVRVCIPWHERCSVFIVIYRDHLVTILSLHVVTHTDYVGRRG